MNLPLKIKVRREISNFASNFLNENQKKGKLIILMYHALTEAAIPDSDQLTVSSSLFALQMKWLKEFGYSVLPLREGVRRLCKGGLDSPVIAITFDDGYRSVFTHAFPVLQENGFSATIFLVPGVMNKTVAPTFMPKEYGTCMAWRDAREMLKYGMAFGAHGMTHRKLSHLSGKEVETEVKDSKKIIEDSLSTGVEDFAYPYGSFDAFNCFSEIILEKCGFKSVSTTISGFNRFPNDSKRLKRLRVSWIDDSIGELKKQCLGAYNWYSLCQRIQSFSTATVP